MKHIFLIVFCLAMSMTLLAQDERFFRQLFTGELTRTEAKIQGDLKDHQYSYIVQTPYYSIDLASGGPRIQVAYVKRDSDDFLEIFDHDKKKVFSGLLEAKGYGAQIYKIEKRKISSITDVLLIYYYEGMSKYINMQSTSRLYVVTIDNYKLDSIKMVKGASFFEEYKSFKNHYHIKDFQVYLEDINNDQVSEVVVKHNLMSEVLMYHGNGKWKTFRN